MAPLVATNANIVSHHHLHKSVLPVTFARLFFQVLIGLTGTWCLHGRLVPYVNSRVVAWLDSFPPSPLCLLPCICLQCALLGSDCCLCLLARYFSRCWSQTLTGDGVLCVGRYVSMSVGSASTSASFALAFVAVCATRCWWVPLPWACPLPSAYGPRP